MSTEANDDIAQLLGALTSVEASERAEAAHQLGQLEESGPDVILALERSVAKDRDTLVQEKALEALNSPANSRLRRQLKPVITNTRKILLAEIARWDAEGLIQPPLTQLLTGRYALTTARPPKKKKPATRAEHWSLGQVLLSETSIKAALFLGAFFILAAALILATLVEVARLPILSVTTIAFLVGAGVLYRRLRLSSFIMFIVGALLIAIDGRILLDQLGIEGQDALISWAVITTLLALIFAVGVTLYDSRLFSLLSYSSLITTVALVTFRQDLDPHVIYLLAAFLAAAGILVAQILKGLRGRYLFWPLFLAAHILLAAALAASVLTLLYQAIDESTPTGILWLPVGGLWLVACLTYFASGQMMARLGPGSYRNAQGFFALLSVGTITPVPLLLAGAFGPTDLQLMIIAWLWGLVLAASAEAVDEYFEALPDIYSPLMMITSAALFLLASVQQWLQESVAAVVLLTATAVIYLLLAIRRMRWPLWSGSLLAAYLAYVAAFSLTELASLGIFGGFVQLLPITLFFAVAITLKRRDEADKARWAPPLALSCLVAAINLQFSLSFGEATEMAVILLVYAVLFAIYAWLISFTWAVFGTTASIAAALHFSLYQYDSEFAVWPYVALAAIFYLLGLATTWSSRTSSMNLGDILRWSGLILSFFASMLVSIEGEAASAVPVAFAAMLFTLETFSQRNLWFGYPAALLYFVAYATVLIEIEVTQPQFYSVVAALLGLIMHYLMLRSGNYTPALLTGLVSQLILLSTTYVQMMSTDELQYFIVLFSQALILLMYGVVIRSRSFVVGPVSFVVLAVVSVAVSVLSGLPVALMIGCAGFALLLLGTTGLWFRQRLSTTAGSLSQQLGGWNW